VRDAVKKTIRRKRGGREPAGALVAIGDLNGADAVLVEILRGTGLMDARARWTGGSSQLVQMGDVFNRGPGARRALQLLLRLQGEARRAGGRVTVLLGNHEVMTALRHEGYCTEDEYLSFATREERKRWPARVERAMLRLLLDHPAQGPILPLEPRLEAWKISHVPGQAALRRELGPRGRLGQRLRRLPVAHRAMGCVFVHGGLLPQWAELGIDGLNQYAEREWRQAPAFMRRLPMGSLFRDPDGPLWNRALARGAPGAAALVRRSLALLDAERMVVGHTPTHFAGGDLGEIRTRFGSRLVLVDVGLEQGPYGPRAALVVRRGGRTGEEWTPRGARTLWEDP